MEDFTDRPWFPAALFGVIAIVSLGIGAIAECMPTSIAADPAPDRYKEVDIIKVDKDGWSWYVLRASQYAYPDQYIVLRPEDGRFIPARKED